MHVTEHVDCFKRENILQIKLQINHKYFNKVTSNAVKYCKLFIKKHSSDISGRICFTGTIFDMLKKCKCKMKSAFKWIQTDILGWTRWFKKQTTFN